MPSSGTQTFPTQTSLGDIGLYALKRVGVARTKVTQDHLADVAMASNLVLSDLSTEQPFLYRVQLNQVPLVQGTTSYTLPANVLLVLNCYIRTSVGGQPNDRVIFGVSRDEYSAYPIKTIQQPPTVYWADRVVPVQMNLYPAPDGNGPYTLFYYAVIQDDDAVLGTAAGLDLPYRMMKAFVDGLVAELSLTYDKQNAGMYSVTYQGTDGHGGSKGRALVQDRENVAMHITPGLQRYYQR